MRIEEAGLKEMQITNKVQERNAKLLNEANSSWYRANWKMRAGEYDDDAQKKARVWDDLKDDNPRGPAIRSSLAVGRTQQQTAPRLPCIFFRNLARTSSGDTPAIFRLLDMQAATPDPSERGSVR